jgi:hypothetical protein
VVWVVSSTTRRSIGFTEMATAWTRAHGAAAATRAQELLAVWDTIHPMPRIFDNITLPLLPALKETLQLSQRADFCVGYFNLRGRRLIDRLIDDWPGGEGACCRLLVGMQPLPQEELRTALSLTQSDDGVDQQTVARLKKWMAEEFREQLMLGAPTNEDEAGLRRLCAQLRSKKLVVKLFLRHPLHAKLYLVYREDPISPKVGFLGSSNLTLAGLVK